jgi:hypothetical protein
MAAGSTLKAFVMQAAWAVALIAVWILQPGGAPGGGRVAAERAGGGGAEKTLDDAALAREARRLIRQLDAAEVAERDSAFSQLMELGPGVLAHLPKQSDNAPAAVRDAVRRLRREFDRQAADAAMQASRVTLDAKGMALTQIAAELEKQTGNKLLVEAPPELTMDVELKGVPFWQALDTIADRAKLSIYPFAQDGLRLRPGVPKMRPRSSAAFYSGPVRFEATGLRLERDLRTTTSANLHVALEIAWEPRLQPITLRQRLDAVHAQDDQGQPIAMASQGERSAMVQQGSSAVEIELPFLAPPRNVRSIGSLAGTMQVLVPGKIEQFEFTDLSNAKKQEQQRHQAIVTLEDVRKVNQIWEVRLRVKYIEAFNALDSHLVSWMLNNEAYLTDKSGKRVENAGFETTHRSEDEIGVAYLFDAAGGLAGHTFVYRAPSTIYELPVKYELKDLELP